MRRALAAHDSPPVPSEAGTAAATADLSHHRPQQNATQPQHVAQGISHPGLLPSALGNCLVPVRVQMLGKGTAHAAAAIVVHHSCPSQQDTPTSPLFNRPLAGSQQAGVFGTESQPRSQPEYKPEFESHPPQLSRHSQQTGESHAIEGTKATVISSSQQSRRQDGVKAHGHQSGADYDALKLVGAKRVRLDKPLPLGVSLSTDYDVLAMECDDGEEASKQLQMQQSTDSKANEEEQDEDEGSGKEHEEEEEGSPDEQLRRTVIGFVTSEAPRGLSGEAGARALCSLTALRQLYLKQVEAKLLRNSRHGVVVHVNNCSSSQHWKAALHQTDSVPWAQDVATIKLRSSCGPRFDVVARVLQFAYTSLQQTLDLCKQNNK